jgi:UDP-glucose 4-epimerase
MKVLVTGVAGFIAGHVAAHLSRAGHEVLGFDVRPGGGWRTLIGDLSDPVGVEQAVAEVDAVCHLAGVGDVYRALEDPVGAATANVVGTTNLAEAAHRQGGKKLVYASTWEVYGHPRYQPIDESHPCAPDHPYNITKLGGEQMLLAYDRLKDVPAVALRLGTAFGLGMRPNSVFSTFIARALAGQSITIHGSGEQTRQFTHASDIAKAFRLALESNVRGVALNIVSSESTSIRRLAELVAGRIPTTIEYQPARLGDISPAVVLSARARKVLGWEPRVLFEDGLNELIDAALSPNGCTVAGAPQAITRG